MEARSSKVDPSASKRIDVILTKTGTTVSNPLWLITVVDPPKEVV